MTSTEHLHKFRVITQYIVENGNLHLYFDNRIFSCGIIYEDEMIPVEYIIDKHDNESMIFWPDADAEITINLGTKSKKENAVIQKVYDIIVCEQIAEELFEF